MLLTPLAVARVAAAMVLRDRRLRLHVFRFLVRVDLIFLGEIFHSNRRRFWVIVKGVVATLFA